MNIRGLLEAGRDLSGWIKGSSGKIWREPEKNERREEG